jgi:peptide/nickel transport system permease protein
MVAIAPRHRIALRVPLARSRRSAGSWSIAIGVGILALLITFAVALPLISSAGATTLTDRVLAPPSLSHPMGTDEYGRDIAVRVALALRLDYLMSASAVTVSLLVGTSLGVLVGSARNPIWGNLLMRLTDALIAVPFVLLVLLIVLTVGPEWRPFGVPAGVPGLMVAVLLTGWSIYARLARTQAAALSGQDFVLGARLMGYSRARILLRHILPNAFAASFAYAVSDCVLVIALIGGLAFIGAGVTPPTPELGAMMYDGRSVISSAVWVTAFPALVLILTAIGVTLFTSGLLARQERR